jgi:hypothetical protein
MNAQTLFDLTRQRSRETLRAAENERLGRRAATPHNRAWRVRLAAAVTATGESLLALGHTLSERT